MTNTKCRICGESNQNQVFDAKEMMFGTNDIFTYFQCSYCQCLQILDIPDNLSRFYSSDDYYSLNISVANLYKNKLKNTLKYLRDNYIIFWRNFLTSKILQNSQIYLFSNIPTLNKENSILDIGCGKGEMLYRLRNSGFRNLTGIDPNVDKDIIYDDNLKILKKDTGEIKEKFDIITMVQTYLTIPEKDKIWAVSPVFLDKKTRHLAKQKHVNEKFYKISATLTSGMLVKTSIFTEIGFFDEKYYIYHVDTEYCFRAKKFNYRIFEIPSAILHHQEGDQTRHSFLWKKKILVTNHSPIARYYISRNLIFLFKRYFFTNNISNLLKIIKSDLLVTSKLLFFEKNRVQKILKNIKGLVHGLINRGGVY